MKTISKFRVRQKLQVISKLGDRHVVLGQKYSGVAECFFIVRDNFERVLQSNPSIPVDAEVQRNKETGLVSVVNHSDEIYGIFCRHTRSFSKFETDEATSDDTEDATDKSTRIQL